MTPEAAIQNADHLLICAGAGMGVDSGLPDFRGDEGFWNAYPPYRKLGFSFVQMASPSAFLHDPPLAWGFYGHRLALYRKTKPHEGFEILLRWAQQKKSYFIFTSNVDGQFQKAGFSEERIYECHGSIHHRQCAGPCDNTIEPADSAELQIDMNTMRAQAPLPRCPRCQLSSRPNILMFGDYGYLGTRSQAQRNRYLLWLAKEVGTESLTVVEMGAGTQIPSVRMESERLSEGKDVWLVRINPRESQVPKGHFGLAQGAREALTAIDSKM